MSLIAAVLGTVLFFVDAKSDFDLWTKNPTQEQQQFMRNNYHRMQTYTTYFDSRLSWYDRAWVYKDAMAIKPVWQVFSTNPEWVLRDINSAFVFLDWGCSGGTCPQYLADIGNPNFRAWWIAEAIRLTEVVGYKGIWIDDVNFDWRGTDGNGNRIIPVDPRTGQQMSLSNWRKYFAEFLEGIRQALPEVEIAHNSIWYANYDEYVERQILSSDYINIERGITDSGITGGTGKYSFQSFTNFVDRVQGLGKKVIMDDDDDSSESSRDYELAYYFLIKKEGDMIGADGDRSRMNPDNFWEGYNTNLGQALGDYYIDQNVYKRSFTKGRVEVYPPPISTGVIIKKDFPPMPPRIQ